MTTNGLKTFMIALTLVAFTPVSSVGAAELSAETLSVLSKVSVEFKEFSGKINKIISSEVISSDNQGSDMKTYKVIGFHSPQGDSGKDRYFLFTIKEVLVKDVFSPKESPLYFPRYTAEIVEMKD